MNKRLLTYVGAAVLAIAGAALLAVSISRGENEPAAAVEAVAAPVEATVEPVPDDVVDPDAGADPEAESTDADDDVELVAAATPITVDVPDTFLQMSFALDTERSYAGQLRPGDLVGVYVSYAESEVTDLVLQKVLVSAIREEAPLPIDDGAIDRLPAAPAGRFFVTLALSADDGEKLAHALEFGRIWLAYEPGLADERAPGVATQENVLTEPVAGDQAATPDVVAAEGV